jgi:type I restriction enzyme S subunit
MGSNHKDSWKSVKLKDVCREITVGHVGPMADEYTESDIPFLRSQNVLPFHLDLSSVKFISPEFHSKLKKSALQPGDVIVVRTGYPGTACVVPAKLPIANCADLVIIRTLPQLDPYYLSCLFNSTWGRSTVAGRLVGVAQQHFNVSAAKEMRIDLPPLSTQRTIAGILSAYDDLIENNTRRIAILEEMARALYHEWFVKFRFPGHENVKMVESELGMIPEGWEVVRFFDIVDVLSGGTPKTTVSDYWNGDIPFYTPKDAPDSFFVTATEKSITEAGLKTCNSKLYPKNTVFITARGTVGKIALNAIDMAMNQSCYALRGRDGINQLFVFMHIHNCIRQLKKTATGAVFDTIIVDTFKQLKVVKPPSALIEAFARTASPIFDQILNLTQRNTDLRRARDLLLPKLISGEIDVSGWAGGVYEEMAESLAGGPGARRVAEARPDVGAITPIDKDALQWRSLWDEE